MREQSHKHEMSAAIRGDFERLRERGVAATLSPRDEMPPGNAWVEPTQASVPPAPLAADHPEPSIPAALVQAEFAAGSEVEDASEPEPKSFKEPEPEPETEAGLELASAESSNAPESEPDPNPIPVIGPRADTGDPSQDGERPGFLARLLGR